MPTLSNKQISPTCHSHQTSQSHQTGQSHQQANLTNKQISPTNQSHQHANLTKQANLIKQTNLIKQASQSCQTSQSHQQANLTMERCRLSQSQPEPVAAACGFSLPVAGTVSSLTADPHCTCLWGRPHPGGYPDHPPAATLPLCCCPPLSNLRGRKHRKSASI